MNFNQAKKLAEYHSYTKIELFNILQEALQKEKPEFWNKPNSVNRMFTNGYYFNQVLSWIKYEKGVNDNQKVTIIIAGRVLQTFSKYSKHLPTKKEKWTPEFIHHEEPSLTPKKEKP